MSGNPLDLLGMAKPVSTFIEKCSDAVGGLAKPWQEKRVRRAEAEGDADAAIIRAQGEAEAELIRAQSSIQLSDLQREAMHRLFVEEERYQSSMKIILLEADEQVDKEAFVAEEMDDDWIVNFFQNARIVSDDEMQTLWARILAGEANEPSSFSRKTVNIMADLGKRDAQLFKALADFVWEIDGRSVIVDIDVTDEFYTKRDINFESMSTLTELGLIARMIPGFDSSARMIRGHEPVLPVSDQKAIASYGTQTLELCFDKLSGNYLWVGSWKFTQVGVELLSICSKEPIEGFFNWRL